MNKLKHIGVASITVPGALLCIGTIVEESYNHFGKASKNHPHITFTQPPLNEIENLLAEKDWDQVAQCLLASIEILYKAGVDFVSHSIKRFPLCNQTSPNKSPLPV